MDHTATAEDVDDKAAGEGVCRPSPFTLLLRPELGRAAAKSLERQKHPSRRHWMFPKTSAGAKDTADVDEVDDDESW